MKLEVKIRIKKTEHRLFLTQLRNHNSIENSFSHHRIYFVGSWDSGNFSSDFADNAISIVDCILFFERFGAFPQLVYQNQSLQKICIELPEKESNDAQRKMGAVAFCFCDAGHFILFGFALLVASIDVGKCDDRAYSLFRIYTENRKIGKAN